MEKENKILTAAREACLRSLVNVEKNKSYSTLELTDAVSKNHFDSDSDKLNRTFFTRLFYGVIENKLTLDYYIENICDKTKKIDPVIINILRMGLYQILYMDKVPDSAACDESVKLAKKFNPKNIKIGGFVNAVLRNFIRTKENQIKNTENIKNFDKYLEIKYSCSSGIIKIWEESYGRDIAVKILEKSREKRGLTITVNALKISRDEYYKNLLLQDIILIIERIERTEISPSGLIITGDIPVKNLYGYGDGLFFVQDESSQVCAFETGAKPGDLVIDCCSAPGGKSFFMAQMMKNTGKIISLDLHKNKLGLINDSAKRLGIDIIETYEHDSTIKFDKLNNSKADIVLCDVPCSGLGVISKKPEIKYKTPDEISKLPELQYKILSACSNYVKPDGTLVYSTCTLNKKENEEVVKKFLDENKNFECVNTKTFFPFERKIDGFFLAKMRRNGV